MFMLPFETVDPFIYIPHQLDKNMNRPEIKQEKNKFTFLIS
ncbi:hypothetical protein LRU_00207 [Ligilactobacillus ruminis SPM0211]|uniref:Uncharacterized protein n=1 Tax=Ligilactobacillus ruminis SPM0211 TaxID=1040964 RepID=F7QXR7_9LACO|nr:hypothetical protein LRU_00207 [Ligilactobacillus ruminis SPM0211]